MVIKVFRIPIAFNFSQIVVKSHRFKFQVKFLNFINNKLRLFFDYYYIPSVCFFKKFFFDNLSNFFFLKYPFF